jgi:hypothetical protein
MIRVHSYAAALLADERTHCVFAITISVYCAIALQADKDQELRSQKVATIRMMYEQVADEFEVGRIKFSWPVEIDGNLQKLKSDIQKTGNEVMQAKIDQKSQLLHRLEEQLFTLTGIAAESQIRSPMGHTDIDTDEGLPPPHPQSSSVCRIG